MGFILGGGGGVGGLKSGVFFCLLVDGPITGGGTFKCGGEGEPISGSLWYLVHLHTAQLSCDYLYVVLLLAPYISLVYSSFELRVNAKIKSPLGWATFNPKFLA